MKERVIRTAVQAVVAAAAVIIIEVLPTLQAGHAPSAQDLTTAFWIGVSAAATVVLTALHYKVQPPSR